MKVVEKFTVNLIPDTLQLAYMGAKTVEVGVEINTFNDGISTSTDSIYHKRF